MHGEKMPTGILRGNVREADDLKDLEVDGCITVGYVFKKRDGKRRTGVVCFKISVSG
jgi:hypothetical protein